MAKSFDIKYIAQLAKIELDKNQKKKFSKEIKKILAFIEKLKKLNTSKISELTHVIPMKNVFREDKVLPSLSQEEFLDLVPKREGHFVKVPKIIEKK